MRKLTVALLLGLLLSFGLAFAQEDADDAVVVVVQEDDAILTDNAAEDYWAGFSFGYPGVELYFGLNDLIGQNIDLRTSLGVSYYAAFTLGADALFALPIDVDAPLSFYAGGGPFLGFGGGVDVGINLLAGAEYRLSGIDFSAGGIFFEVGPSLVFTGFAAGFNAHLGFNYHF